MRWFKDVDAELLGDILSQLRMNPSRNENKILIGLPFKDCAHHVSPTCGLVDAVFSIAVLHDWLDNSALPAVHLPLAIHCSMACLTAFA